MSKNKFKFTKAGLENLTKFGFYYDSEVRGLCVKVNHGGSKTFYVYRRVRNDVGFGSKPERIKLGFFPELTIEQARNRAEEVNAEIAKGDNPLQAKRTYKESPTLGELFDAYLNRHLRKGRKQCAIVEKSFQRWFGSWRDRKALTITRTELEQLHAAVGVDRGKYAANRAIELFRAIFNKALQWNLLEGQNPATHITQYVEVSRERVLREDEFERFFNALAEEQNYDLKDFVMLTLFTGQRKSNVLGMRWKDIDFKAASWTIPGELMKNGQTLVLSLTPDEIKILQRRQVGTNSQFVFPGTGKTLHFVEPKKAWKKLLERAEIDDLRIHDLRRSLASYMAMTGANVALISGALNHKDIKTTMNVYIRTAKQSQMEARQKAHQKMMEFGEITETSNVVPFRKRLEG